MLTPLPPGTASAGYFISDEDRFNGTQGQFEATLFDVDMPNAAGDDYLSRALPGSQLRELLGVNRGPNLRPDGFKAVRCLTSANPNWDGNEPTLADLDTLLACLGTVVQVEFAGPYKLVYDGDPNRPGGITGGVQTWRDGRMKAPCPKVPCKWVPADSPEAVAVNVPEWAADFNSTGTPPGYPVGFEVRYTFGGVEGHYVAVVAGQLPAPTSPSNDTNWRRVAPPTPATVLYQVLPYAAAVNYDDNDGLVRGREYLITERPGGGPAVHGTFSAFAPAAMQYATLEGQPGAFTYDLASDEALPAGLSDTADPADVPLALRQAVVDGFAAQEAGGSQSPYLLSAAPAGSQVWQFFTDPQAGRHYVFGPVAFATKTVNAWFWWPVGGTLPYDDTALTARVTAAEARLSAVEGRPGAVSTLWQAGGAAYVVGQLVHNSQGQQFRTLQANASHATEPTLPLSSGLATYYRFIGWDESRVAAVEARPLAPTSTDGLAEGSNADRRYFSQARENALNTAISGNSTAIANLQTANQKFTIQNYTGNFGLAFPFAEGKVLQNSTATNLTCTINSSDVVAHPVGAFCYVRQLGDGTITFVANGTTPPTLTFVGCAPTTAKGQMLFVQQIAPDSWLITPAQGNSLNGSIQKVGSKYVKAEIIGTTGAYTWQFTEL